MTEYMVESNTIKEKQHKTIKRKQHTTAKKGGV